MKTDPFEAVEEGDGSLRAVDRKLSEHVREPRARRGQSSSEKRHRKDSPPRPTSDAAGTESAAILFESPLPKRPKPSTCLYPSAGKIRVGIHNLTPTTPVLEVLLLWWVTMASDVGKPAKRPEYFDVSGRSLVGRSSGACRQDLQIDQFESSIQNH